MESLLLETISIRIYILALVRKKMKNHARLYLCRNENRESCEFNIRF